MNSPFYKLTQFLCASLSETAWSKKGKKKKGEGKKREKVESGSKIP